MIEKRSPRGGRPIAGTESMEGTNHTFAPLIGKLGAFRCSFCGDLFPWSGLGGFGNRMRFCDPCAHALEQIFAGGAAR